MFSFAFYQTVSSIEVFTFQIDECFYYKSVPENGIECIQVKTVNTESMSTHGAEGSTLGPLILGNLSYISKSQLRFTSSVIVGYHIVLLNPKEKIITKALSNFHQICNFVEETLRDLGATSH